MVLRKVEMAASSTEPDLTHRVKGEKARYWWCSVCPWSVPRCLHKLFNRKHSKSLTRKLPVNYFFPDLLYLQYIRVQTFSRPSGVKDTEGIPQECKLCRLQYSRHEPKLWQNQNWCFVDLMKRTSSTNSMHTITLPITKLSWCAEIRSQEEDGKPGKLGKTWQPISSCSRESS